MAMQNLASPMQLGFPISNYTMSLSLLERIEFWDTNEDAIGEDIPDPESLDPSDPNPFVSASAACRNVNLFAAIAEAAGEELDYGSFQAAGEGLGEVHLPGAEDDYDYGPYPARDGNQAMFLWDWDAAEGRFVLDDR